MKKILSSFLGYKNFYYHFLVHAHGDRSICQFTQCLARPGRESVDEQYAHELTQLHEEIDNIAGCLVHMLTIIRKELGYHNPFISKDELQDISYLMSHEEREKQREAFYQQGIFEQTVIVFTDAAKIIARETIAKWAFVSLNTDLEGSHWGRIGPLMCPLRMHKVDDGTELSFAIAKNLSQCAQDIPQDQAAPPTSGQQAVTRQQSQMAASVAELQGTDHRHQVLQCVSYLLQHKQQLQVHDTAIRAYVPLECILIMPDNGNPLSHQELQYEMIQTMAGAHYASMQAADQGQTEQANNWAGLRDALGQLYDLSWRVANFHKLSESLNNLDKLAQIAKGMTVGSLKGGFDFGQWIYTCVTNPRSAAMDIERNLVKLDYYAGKLFRGDPRTLAALRSLLKNFWQQPVAWQAENLSRIAVSMKIAPELLSKGVGQLCKLAQENGYVAKVGQVTRHISETVRDVIKGKKAPVAMAPEGAQVPVTKSWQAFMESERAAQGGAKARSVTEAKPVSEPIQPCTSKIEAETVKTSVGDIKPAVSERVDIVPANWAEVKAVEKHNADFKVKVSANTPKIEVEFLEDKIPHIFDSREGHLPDTPENRALLIEVASDPKNYFAQPDIHGNIWCEKILRDGSQVWVSLRKNKIRNGGLNLVPIKWNASTGLASLTLPK